MNLFFLVLKTIFFKQAQRASEYNIFSNSLVIHKLNKRNHNRDGVRSNTVLSV